MPTAIQGRGAPRVLANSEEEVLAAASRGDEHAFAVLVTALTPSLQRFAECILRDAERASAAVQDAWLAAWESMRTFESVDHLTGWMYRVVRCRAISIIRKQKRVFSVTWSDEPGEEPGLPSPAAPESDALPCEVASEVRKVVDRLPDAYRGVATLFYLHQQPLREVSRLVALPVSTVKMRLHRARDWLRKRLRTHAPA